MWVGRVSATTLITKTMVDPFLKEAVSRASNFLKGFPSDSLRSERVPTGENLGGKPYSEPAATTSIETERLRFVSFGDTFVL